MCRLFGAALLALLLAQWTALTHAIAHPPLAAPGVVAIADEGRWGHDAGTSSCELIDHLLIGELGGGDPPALPSVRPATTPVATPNLPIACGATLRAYEARGPPWA